MLQVQVACCLSRGLRSPMSVCGPGRLFSVREIILFLKIMSMCSATG